MPRASASRLKGLTKHHNRQCTNRGDPAKCKCPWWSCYRGVEVSLSRWSRQDVPPTEKRLAEQILNRLKAAVDQKVFSYAGEVPAKGGETSLREFIAEFTTHWIEARNQTSTSTSAMLGIIASGLGSYSLNQLVADEGAVTIERWLNDLQRRRGFSDRTWNHYHELLRRLFNRAIKWRRVKTNPMFFVDPKTACSTKKKVGVRVEEPVEDRLLAACDRLDEGCAPPPNRTMLDWVKVAEIRKRVEAGESQATVAQAFGVSRTTVCQIVNEATWVRDRFHGQVSGREMRRRVIAAFDLGLRASEMLRVTLDMVDFTPQIVETDGGRREVFCIALPPEVTKGGKRTGEVEYVYAGTDRVRAVLLERRAQLQTNPDFRQFVFGREDGSFVASFDRPWRRLFTLAGLRWGRKKGLVWHTLRHEFVSRTLEQTGDPVVAQAMARHKDVRTTQGYLHARPQRLLAAAVALDRHGARHHAASRPTGPSTEVAAPAGNYAVPMLGGNVLPFPKKSA